MKYLVLRLNKSGVFFKYINDKHISNIYCIDSSFKYFDLCIKIFRKLNIGNFFFGKWKKEIKYCNKVIVFDNGYMSYISKYIKKKNPNCKIIFYFWNYVDDYTKKFFNDKNIDEFYTFDETDAITYNMKYNPQVYTKNIKLKNNVIDNDALFLGRAKARKNEILNLKKILEKNNIKTNFLIIESEKDLVNYEEYLQLISKTNCLLDIITDTHSGLTLRCLEALFFSKKLITNNKKIVNYDFYNKNNIFILGIDDIKNIKEFFEIPFQEVDKDIVLKYDYENWLKRFL